MSDLSSDQHAVINRQLRRLRRLTVASLLINGLVLLLILLGVIIHHHKKHEHHDNCHEHGDFGRGNEGREGFQHHRFMDHGGWDRERGRDFDRSEADDRGGDFERGGDGPKFDQHGPGFGGPGGDEDGPGGHHHGMGMMGAGGPPDPAKMTDGILDHLTQKLTLTDDQKAKIKPIVAAGVAQMQKDAEQRKADMQKQIEDAKAKIKPILNADQQKELDAMPMPGEKPDGAGPETEGK